MSRYFSQSKLMLFLTCILLFLIIGVMLTALIAWLLRPDVINVRVGIEPFSFCRYDDHAGNYPMGALVRITNMSKCDVWFLGVPGVPAYVNQQLIDDKWDSALSSVSMMSDPMPIVSNRWATLRSRESITILAGPISEKATEMRVGIPFATNKSSPKSMHLVFSPTVKIMERESDYFPEMKKKSQQEDRVLPIPCDFTDIEIPPR